jgi:hypothetical protein
MRTLLPLLALAACAGSTPGDDLAGRTAGVAEDCVPAIEGESFRVVDAQTLLYGRGRTVWQSRLETPCRSLRADDRLIVETSAGRYCRDDRFRGFGLNGVPGPVCRLGPFTPYRR